MISIGTPLLWTLFVIFVVIALAIDFFALNKQGAHAVTMREATIWSLIWVAVSFLFVGWLWWHLGGLGIDPAAKAVADAKALEFVTGYVVEDIEGMMDAVMNISSIDRTQCRSHALENFNNKKMTDGYEEIYRKILTSTSE